MLTPGAGLAQFVAELPGKLVGAVAELVDREVPGAG